MKRTKVKSFFGTITIGQQLGYSNITYSKQLLIESIQAYQKEKIKTHKIYLSAAISECEIVLSGQVEPHFKLDFINYPKFPLDEFSFKKEVELLTVFLMDNLQQNRILLVYHNETKMFEKSEDIDPRI